MTDEPRVYLDHNASAPLRPSAAAAMSRAMALTGNPSSMHAEGRGLRGLIERARRDVAALVGCEPSHVIFTSGATEANAMAVAHLNEPAAASLIEHPAVLGNIKKIKELPVSSDGVIVPDSASVLVPEIETLCAMVVIMAANNETGVLQPVEEMSEICRERNIPVHSDSVQLAGKAPLGPVWEACDSLSLSAHKIGGPTGVGALIARDPSAIPSLIGGGGQEQCRRAGTENVTGIVGFGAAARDALLELEEWRKIDDQRRMLEAEMRRICPDVVIFGSDAERLPNTTCAAVPGVAAELLLMKLDLAGIAISAGSACSSGKASGSQVLGAMGVSKGLARSAIRISQGLYTATGNLDRFLSAWSEAVCRK